MMNYYRHINKADVMIDFASTNFADKELLDELYINNSHYYNLSSRKKNVFKYIYNLYKLLNTTKYNVVHVNGNSATMTIELLVAKLCGVKKRIAHCHSSKCDYVVLHKFLKPLFDKLYTNALAVSDDAGRWIYGRNYIILKNAIDISKFSFNLDKRLHTREKYGIADNVKLIGHVGKFYLPKNHGYIIEVFRELHLMNKNIYLMLVGDGELRVNIENQIKQFGLQDSVIITGMQKNTEVFYSALDYFIFPSLWEGMPLALLEAQASGLPAMISNNIDKDVIVSEYTKNESIDVDPTVWAAYINKSILYDRNVVENENISRLRICGYDIKDNADKLLRIYYNE